MKILKLLASIKILTRDLQVLIKVDNNWKTKSFSIPAPNITRLCNHFVESIIVHFRWVVNNLLVNVCSIYSNVFDEIPHSIVQL